MYIIYIITSFWPGRMLSQIDVYNRTAASFLSNHFDYLFSLQKRRLIASLHTFYYNLIPFPTFKLSEQV